MGIELIIGFILNLVIILVVGQMIWSKRQDKIKLDNTHDRVISLEVKHEGVASDVHEIKTDTREIKRVVTELLVAQAQK